MFGVKSFRSVARRRPPLTVPSSLLSYRVQRHLSYTNVQRYPHNDSKKEKSEEQSEQKENNKSEQINHDDIQPESFPRTKSAVDNFLENIRPHLNSAHQQYEKTKTQVNNVIVPIKFHWNKATKAISDVNEKLAQQEKESQNYDFKQDLTNNGNSNDKTIQGLPSERESKRKQWAKKLELYIDSLQETIFTATRALNDVTGYSSIQKLRESIEVLEKDLDNAKETARITKEQYSDAISKRLTTQKEVNELLQRQHSWSPADLERFTQLYKDDHENATNERKTKEEMEAADVREEEVQNKLSKAILTRYHEEQIWSDKIRRTSTWGTFGLMGLNILLFLVFQLALEPWKRRRLVGNFEEKVQRVLEENAYLQNKKLDLMNKKVEDLKDSDRFPVLNQSLREEIVDDPIDAPTVGVLPLPMKSSSLKDQLVLKSQKFTQLFKPSYNLITEQGPSEATLKKEELITFTSVVLVTGLAMGSIMSSFFN